MAHRTDPKICKLIYEGKLTQKIFYLKGWSILTSLGLTGSYGYVITQKGLSMTTGGVGLSFVPFLVSPFVVGWFFRRYVTQLHYNPDRETFTARYYGLLLTQQSLEFEPSSVTRPGATSMLTTFSVGNRPFFVNEEDLKGAGSVQLYKKMLGLNVRPKSAQLSDS